MRWTFPVLAVMILARPREAIAEPLTAASETAPARPAAVSDAAAAQRAPDAATAPQVAGAATATAVPSFRLAAAAEEAVGLPYRSFENHLVGARLDYLFTPTLALGVFLGYANLKGRDGRASNLLGYWQLEYRPRLGGDASRVGMPIRFATGYLPNNGPFARPAVGVSYELTAKTSIVLDLLAPTLWVVENRPAASLDLGLEIEAAW